MEICWYVICTLLTFKFARVQGAEQRRQINMDNDEELLQFAVQQSLLETGAEEDQVSCVCYGLVTFIS